MGRVWGCWGLSGVSLGSHWAIRFAWGSCWVILVLMEHWDLIGVSVDFS